MYRWMNGDNISVRGLYRTCTSDELDNGLKHQCWIPLGERDKDKECSGIRSRASTHQMDKLGFCDQMYFVPYPKYLLYVDTKQNYPVSFEWMIIRKNVMFLYVYVNIVNR